MNRLKYKILWITLGVLGVILTIYLSLRSVPNEPPSFLHSDKFYHFICYATLGFWHFELYQKKKLFFALLFFLGLFIEFAQGYSGHRFFELMDLVANTLGILAAFFLSKIYKIDFFTRIERDLLRLQK